MVKQRLISAMIPLLNFNTLFTHHTDIRHPHHPTTSPSYPSSFWNNVTWAHTGTQGDHREDSKLAPPPSLQLIGVQPCAYMITGDFFSSSSPYPPPPYPTFTYTHTHTHLPNKEKGRLINVRGRVFTEMQSLLHRFHPSTSSSSSCSSPSTSPPTPPPHIPCRLKSLDSSLMT